MFASGGRETKRKGGGGEWQHVKIGVKKNEVLRGKRINRVVRRRGWGRGGVKKIEKHLGGGSGRSKWKKDRRGSSGT